MATSAAGSQYSIQYVTEVTLGTTPGTPAMTYIRNTGCTLNYDRENYESKEIRSDRMVTDVRLGVGEIGGDLDFELVMGNLDDLLESAFFGAWTTNVLVNGVTRKSFSIEKGFTDIDQYHLMKGCVVDKLSLSMKPGGMVTGKLTFKGMSMAVAATPQDASPTAATTNLPMSCYEGALLEGGTTVAVVTAVDLNLENNLEVVKVLCTTTPIDIVAGRSRVSGTITAIFQDNAMLAKFLAETPSTLAVTCGTTKTYKFEIPNLKYTGGKVDVNTEGLLTISMPFLGVYDAVTGCSIKVTRVP